jgi:hypothetical protein
MTLYIYAKLGTSIFYDTETPGLEPGWVQMLSYPPATSSHGYTYFEYRAQADGTWVEVQIPPPAKPVVLHDGKLKTVSPDNSMEELAGWQMPAKRRVRKDITLGAGGVATISITPTPPEPGYAVTPQVDPIATYNAAKTLQFIPKVTAVSPTSLTVEAVRTKGTVLLNVGVVEAAVAGDVVSVWIIEQ